MQLKNKKDTRIGIRYFQNDSILNYLLTSNGLNKSWFKIRSVKMIITLSVSVDLPYLHIILKIVVVMLGNRYNHTHITTNMHFTSVLCLDTK